MKEYFQIITYVRTYMAFICAILCPRIVSKNNLEATHLHIKQFLLKFMGVNILPPNIHIHLYDCCQDNPSVYAFWCFISTVGRVNPFQFRNNSNHNLLSKVYEKVP